MAKGRIINNKITLNKKVHNLSCDTSRLAFTWAITFADCEGRMPGDPTIVRSLVFPRRHDVTDEQMQTYIQEWAAQNLIVWYEADDDLWIYFVGFADNQVGLRKNREAPSHIPAPPLRSGSGEGTEEVPVKLKEKKRKEITLGDVNTFYENNITSLTPYTSEELIDTFDEFGGDWLMDAMKIACENNARNMRYIRAVLNNRKDGKYPSKKEYQGKENNNVWAEEHY